MTQQSGTLNERDPLTHSVKSWPHLFAATRSGEKKHEMRKVSDRDYRVGDVLRLQEYIPDPGRYTGEEVFVKITYITSFDNPCALSSDGLREAYCILSIEKISEA